MVRRRQVFHIAGYDPGDAEAFYRRFARQLKIFQITWKVDADLSKPDDPARRLTAAVHAGGANWRTESNLELWTWDDLVRADAAVSLPVRLWRAAITFLDLFVSGTMFRYVWANVRYGMFSFFPLVQVAFFAACGWLAGRLVSEGLGLAGAAGLAATAAVALAVFAALMHWLGRRWRVQQALDDWIFARDHLLGRRTDLDTRLDGFAQELVARAREASVDEILVVGHSLGAAFALEVVARALAQDPHLGRRDVSVCILTVGATIPKCALHPKAHRLRQAVARVLNEPSIFWAEYQARDDAISFYKFDPAALRRIDGDQFEGKPVIRRLQIHDMLQPATFALHRHRFLRLHYQFVMANDRLASYDYFMAVCGPVPFAQWATAPGGILDFMRPDGSVAETKRIEPVS